MSDSANAENLRILGAEFQKEFERQEALVIEYLSKHPEKPRSFEKNGSTYYISRIGVDGNPVYINTKRPHSEKKRASERPIKVDCLSGGGSR